MPWATPPHQAKNDWQRPVAGGQRHQASSGCGVVGCFHHEITPPRERPDSTPRHEGWLHLIAIWVGETSPCSLMVESSGWNWTHLVEHFSDVKCCSLHSLSSQGIMSWVRTAIQHIQSQDHDFLHQTVSGGYGTKTNVSTASPFGSKNGHGVSPPKIQQKGS